MGDYPAKKLLKAIDSFSARATMQEGRGQHGNYMRRKLNRWQSQSISYHLQRKDALSRIPDCGCNAAGSAFLDQKNYAVANRCVTRQWFNVVCCSISSTRSRAAIRVFGLLMLPRYRRDRQSRDRHIWAICGSLRHSTYG